MLQTDEEERVLKPDEKESVLNTVRKKRMVKKRRGGPVPSVTKRILCSRLSTTPCAQV